MSIEASATPSFAGRVLVVEDNRVNQLMLRTALGRLGLDIEIAGDGEAAIEAWAEGRHDLILLDIDLPLLDGHDVARAIRSREAEARIPIVALTANLSEQDVAGYLAAGMDGAIAKPLQMTEVIALLHRLKRDRSTAPPAASAPALAGSAPAVDFAYLETIAEGDRDFLISLLDAFVEGSRQYLAALDSALRQGSQSPVTKIAHALAGMAGSARAETLRAAARRLEKLPADSGGEALQAAATPVIDAARAALSAVEAYRASMR